MWVDLEGRVVEAEAIAQHLLEARGASAWQSVSRPTSTCAASAGKPEVIVQTCRSCTSRTPSTAQIAATDLLDVGARR